LCRKTKNENTYSGTAIYSHKKQIEPFVKDPEFEVLVASFDSGNAEILKNLPTRIVKTKFGKFGYLLTISEFKKILDEFKQDLVHAHFVTSYGYVAKKLNFHPLVLSVWESDITLAQSNLLRKRLVKEILNSADYVNFAGEWLKKIAINIGFDEKIKHDVFQYGIDIDKITKFRRSLELRDNSIIISPRGFDDVYNWPRQIEAMDRALKSNKNLNLVMYMYGGGDTSYARKMVKDLSLEEKIHVVGKVNQDVLWKEIGKARIVLSVAKRDGTPLSLLESMALGAFPIVSNIAPNREWIKDKNNGFIVDENSPEAIATAISLAVKNYELFMKAFEKNIKIVEGRANYVNNIQRMKEIYLKHK